MRLNEEKAISLNKEDREVLIYIILLLIDTFLLISIFSINQRGSFIAESPRLLPFIVVGCLFVLCTIGLIKSILAKGRPTLQKIKGSLMTVTSSKLSRQTALAVLIVMVYIFLGIQFLGFYLSSFLLICGICLLYVRHIKPYFCIIISLGLVGLLYVIFNIAFHLHL